MMFDTLIGIDYGKKRIGIAVGNTLTRHAEPLEIFTRNAVQTNDDAPLLAHLSLLTRQWQAQGLVLGIPRHPDGAAHDMTAACLNFSRQLHDTLGLPIHHVDERYTSAVLPNRATTNPRGQTRAVAQDDRAAALILQQYLDGLDGMC